MLAGFCVWDLVLNNPSRVGARSGNPSFYLKGSASQRFGLTWAWLSETNIKIIRRKIQIWNRRKTMYKAKEINMISKFRKCYICRRILAILKSALSFSKCPFGNSLMSANFEMCDFFENICDVIVFECLEFFVFRVFGVFGLCLALFTRYSGKL